MQYVNGQCYVKFMHDKTNEKWILGLNFFRDYYVEFSKEGSDNFVSLWAVPNAKRNHTSLVVATQQMGKLIDNSQDKKWQENKADCDGTGVFNTATGVCKKTETKLQQQL